VKNQSEGIPRLFGAREAVAAANFAAESLLTANAACLQV
jgi:hypothetical protein